MSLDGLLLDFVHVCKQELWRRLKGHLYRDLKTHHEQPARVIGGSRYRVGDPWWKIHEVILPN